MIALYGPLPSGTSGLKYGGTPNGSGSPRLSINGVGVGFCAWTARLDAASATINATDSFERIFSSASTSSGQRDGAFAEGTAKAMIESPVRPCRKPPPPAGTTTY